MPGRVIMWNAASPSARGMHGARRPPLPGAAYMRDGGDRKGRRPGIRATRCRASVPVAGRRRCNAAFLGAEGGRTWLLLRPGILPSRASCRQVRGGGPRAHGRALHVDTVLMLVIWHGANPAAWPNIAGQLPAEPARRRMWEGSAAAAAGARCRERQMPQRPAQDVLAARSRRSAIRRSGHCMPAHRAARRPPLPWCCRADCKPSLSWLTT